MVPHMSATILMTIARAPRTQTQYQEYQSFSDSKCGQLRNDQGPGEETEPPPHHKISISESLDLGVSSYCSG